MAKSLEQPKRRTRPRRKLGQSTRPPEEPQVDASDLAALDDLDEMPEPPPVTVVTETTVSLSPTAQVALVLRDNPELVYQTIDELTENANLLSTVLIGLSQEPGLINLLPMELQEFLLEVLSDDDPG